MERSWKAGPYGQVLPAQTAARLSFSLARITNIRSDWRFGTIVHRLATFTRHHGALTKGTIILP